MIAEPVQMSDSLVATLLELPVDATCQTKQPLFTGLDPDERMLLQVVSKKSVDSGRVRVKFRIWLYDVPAGTFTFEVPKPMKKGECHV